MNPSYLSLGEKEFEEKIEKLWDRLDFCDLCGNRCGVNRLKEETGKCRSGRKTKVSSADSHFGEEKPLVGQGGSGTIFLSNCPMCCVYCQNWQISQGGKGRIKTEEEVADMMLNLQDSGCHNINWVTPTHFVPQLVKSLKIAADKGLEVPVVYNTGAYDDPEVIKLLDGIVDIYMPDAKYGSNENGKKYSGVDGYWDILKENLREMHRQVGNLTIDDKGVAERGLLVRHLVLPNGAAESDKVLEFIAEKISRNTYVNTMDQYYPTYNAGDYPEIDRRINHGEFEEVVNRAAELGLQRGFQ